MVAERRRMLGLVALLVAAQTFGACRAAMRSGDPGSEAAPAASASPAVSPAPAKDANPCVSSKCHTAILSGKTVHDAAEGCTDCHDATSPAHPVAGQKTFHLLNDMPDLCYSCHEEFGKKKTVHSPVADGACTECHDPHSSAEEHLLKKPQGEVCKDCHEDPTSGSNLHGPVADGECTSCHDAHEADGATLLLKAVPALCLECHTDVDDTIKTGKVSHAALDTGESCLLCHSPHSSDNAALLPKPVRDVCVDCHDSEIPAKAKSLHGKNNAGNCADCHSPHGGDVEHLLVGEFPGGSYVAWNDKAYPLCFSCHDRDLGRAPQTSSATAFRDGKRNLHYVHVSDGRKGRSCRLCHQWHGSDQPKLLADSVAFGKWSFRLRFVKTETGGSCAPACHVLQVYDRESAGRRPPLSAHADGE